MSGEDEALHCLFSKIDECYDFLSGILSSAGLTQEQAAVMDFTTLWNDEIVNIICEVYEGMFGYLLKPKYICILGGFTEKFNSKPLQRNVVYIPITTSSHATSMASK